MNPRSLLPTFALFAFLLSACSSVHLSRSDASSLHAVSVAKTSGIPDKVELTTFGDIMAGSLGGVAGSLVAYGSETSGRTLLRQRMIEAKADPGLLTAQEFEAQLAPSSLLRLVPRNGDAEFRFEVTRAGLCVPGSFATRLNPVLAVRASLVRRDGKVLWNDTALYTAKDMDEGSYTFQDYVSQPGLLRGSFQHAASDAASQLVDDLRKDITGQREDRVEGRSGTEYLR